MGTKIIKVLKWFDRWMPVAAVSIVAVASVSAGVYNILCTNRVGVGLIALGVGAWCVYFGINDVKRSKEDEIKDKREANKSSQNEVREETGEVRSSVGEQHRTSE